MILNHLWTTRTAIPLGLLIGVPVGIVLVLFPFPELAAISAAAVLH
jgi:ABC-type proline/glycine betaine transport system permease subunit